MKACFVTPAHLASNPRLVKAADALSAEGHQVHVIHARYYPRLDSDDGTILRESKWSHTQVELTTGFEAGWRKLRRKLLHRLRSESLTPSPRVASWMFHAGIDLLGRAARSTSADVYIGHNLAGLAAAGTAATSNNARLAFDAEDFHRAETTEVETSSSAQKLVRTLEENWISKCDVMTAASPLIAEAYADVIHLKAKVETVLNVFPKNMAPPKPANGAASEDPARLYWFSQTIGPGRGLEQLIAILAMTSFPCSLHLRGFVSEDYRRELTDFAKNCGFSGRIEWLSFAPPGEMVRLAADYDLGLSLEQSTPLNRDLCLTNKIFTYLLAGIPVAMTPTRAQRALGTTLGEACLLLEDDNIEQSARTLNDWLANPNRRNASRARAWGLGQTRYNWDVESSALTSCF